MYSEETSVHSQAILLCRTNEPYADFLQRYTTVKCTQGGASAQKVATPALFFFLKYSINTVMLKRAFSTRKKKKSQEVVLHHAPSQLQPPPPPPPLPHKGSVVGLEGPPVLHMPKARHAVPPTRRILQNYDNDKTLVEESNPKKQVLKPKRRSNFIEFFDDQDVQLASALQQVLTTNKR